jgi:hypothetical protein
MRSDVSEESVASIFRIKISEQRKPLVVDEQSNRLTEAEA